MTDSEIPKAVWSGSFWIGGKEIKCHTLDNGVRIIEADSMAALFEGAMNEATEFELRQFSKWKDGK